jgi:hypothetical protein
MYQGYFTPLCFPDIQIYYTSTSRPPALFGWAHCFSEDRFRYSHGRVETDDAGWFLQTGINGVNFSIQDLEITINIQSVENADLELFIASNWLPDEICNTQTCNLSKQSPTSALDVGLLPISMSLLKW